MKKKTVSFTAVAVLAVSLAAAPVVAGDVPVLGLDQDGNPVEAVMTQQAYQENLTGALVQVNEATRTSLQKRADRGPFVLKTVLVGLGVSMEAGLGDLLKVSAVPRFRLLFSNSADPVIP